MFVNKKKLIYLIYDLFRNLVMTFRELRKLQSVCHEGIYYQEENWSFCQLCNRKEMNTKILLCDKCNTEICLKCADLHTPPSSCEDWFCKKCLAPPENKIEIPKRKYTKRSQKNPDDDKIMDICSICNNHFLESRILVCSSCEKDSCLSCAGYQRIPRNDWFCNTCKEQQKQPSFLKLEESSEKKEAKIKEMTSEVVIDKHYLKKDKVGVDPQLQSLMKEINDFQQKLIKDKLTHLTLIIKDLPVKIKEMVEKEINNYSSQLPPSISDIQRLNLLAKFSHQIVTSEKYISMLKDEYEFMRVKYPYLFMEISDINYWKGSFHKGFQQETDIVVDLSQKILWGQQIIKHSQTHFNNESKDKIDKDESVHHLQNCHILGKTVQNSEQPNLHFEGESTLLEPTPKDNAKSTSFSSSVPLSQKRSFNEINNQDPNMENSTQMLVEQRSQDTGANKISKSDNNLVEEKDDSLPAIIPPEHLTPPQSAQWNSTPKDNIQKRSHSMLVSVNKDAQFVDSVNLGEKSILTKSGSNMTSEHQKKHELEVANTLLLGFGE